MRCQSLLLGLSLIALWGECPISAQNPAKKTPGGKSSGAEAGSHTALAARIHFKDADGKSLYELKPEPDGAKLVANDGKELARFVNSGDKLKIKGPDDKVLGYIVRHEDKYKVKDAEQQTDLFTLAAHGKGDWTVENAARERIYKIKHRDYGFEVESAQEKSLAKIKLKESKLSLRNPQDETTISTKDPASPLGMACLALDQIPSLAMRMGLLVQFTIDGRP